MDPIFYGQQEGERVLHIVRPHPLFRVTRLMISLILTGALSYLVFIIGLRFISEEHSLLFSMIIGLIILICLFWWNEIVYRKARAYITDRRFVRVEALFPCFERRRSLFWNEVGKAKGYPANFVFRFLKIGNISIAPLIVPLEDITIKWVYYFDDLVNYIDKILYLHKNEPESLKTLRAFIERPKGERF